MKGAGGGRACAPAPARAPLLNFPDLFSHLPWHRLCPARCGCTGWGGRFGVLGPPDTKSNPWGASPSRRDQSPQLASRAGDRESLGWRSRDRGRGATVPLSPCHNNPAFHPRLGPLSNSFPKGLNHPTWPLSAHPEEEECPLTPTAPSSRDGETEARGKRRARGCSGCSHSFPSSALFSCPPPELGSPPPPGPPAVIYQQRSPDGSPDVSVPRLMMSQRRWAGGRQLLWSPLSDTRGLGPAPRCPRSSWPPPVPASAFPSPPGPSPTRFSSWVDRVGGSQGRLMSQ